MNTISTFDQYFPNRYIITLKENTKRHVHFKNELKKAGIDNYNIQYSKKYIFKSCFKNTASRSITNAHLNIHRLVKNNNTHNALVLEDDICFVDDFKVKVKPILEELKNQDWDIFFFYKPIKGNRSDYDAHRGDIIKRYNSGLLKIAGTINSHAYAINIKNIDKILSTYNLDFIKQIPRQIRLIDKSISQANLNFYACNEDLIYQEERFPSSTMFASPKASLLENIKLYFKPVGND